jgi:hypothetical protein
MAVFTLAVFCFLNMETIVVECGYVRIKHAAE